jgi:hypothetical protein
LYTDTTSHLGKSDNILTWKMRRGRREGEKGREMKKKINLKLEL